jgi:hypothetical protein
VDIILLVILSGIIYAILSSVKNVFFKRSRLLKDKGRTNPVFLTVLLEAVISAIGLLLAVLIVNQFTDTAVSNLVAFGLGSFACFFLVKLVVLKRKPTFE